MNTHEIIAFEHDFFGEIDYEFMKCRRHENDFILETLLCYAKEYSIGDVFSVIYENEKLIARELVSESGHSTVRILKKGIENIDSLILSISSLGCLVKQCGIAQLISIDIPPNISYILMRNILDKGEENEDWEFQESCISYHHQNELSNYIFG